MSEKKVQRTEDLRMQVSPPRAEIIRATAAINIIILLLPCLVLDRSLTGDRLPHRGWTSSGDCLFGALLGW